MAPRARQAKSKARIKAYEAMVGRAVRRTGRQELEIQIPPAPRLGDLVIEADNLSKALWRIG